MVGRGGERVAGNGSVPVFPIRFINGGGGECNDPKELLAE